MLMLPPGYKSSYLGTYMCDKRFRCPDFTKRLLHIFVYVVDKGKGFLN
jgi:hypothetical protein